MAWLLGVTLKVRYEFAEVTNLEVALHDALLEFNSDLADCVIAVAARSDITFKSCQISSSAQLALADEQAVEIDLAEFLRLLCGMVQMIDVHVTITRSRVDRYVVFDLRVVDSSFAVVETENEAILHAFEARLTATRQAPVITGKDR